MTDEPAQDLASAPPPGPWKRWGPALAVIGALGIAHLGLWLLLTRSARHTLAEIEATWGPGELDAARPPAAPPEQAQGETFARWQRTERVWADVERRADRRSWVGALGWTMVVSWLFQAGFVAWIALKAGGPRSHRRDARG